jgi:hypothetical protein
MNNGHNDDNPLDVLAETENFAVLVGEDIEGETIYNVELGTVTLHLFLEEWQELVDLVKAATEK